jgi:hypothetical protein
MSELRSVLDSLRADDVASIPDARLEQDFEELHAVVEAFETERLRRLAEIDRRRLFERDGFLSPVSWLATRCRIGHGQSQDTMVLARGLDRSEPIRKALEAGRVSIGAARVLVRAREAEPDEFERTGRLLIEAAERHSVDDLRRVVAHWREAARCDDASISGGDALRSRRRLHASTTLAGMVRVDGDLDPENGEKLITAISAVLDAEARATSDPDGRSPAQRRADALGEICRSWLDRSDRPQVAGDRPHLLVTVPVESLMATDGRSRSSGRRGPRGPSGNGHLASAELDHTGPVDAATLRRLACDAAIRRVVTAGASEPLDVGRRTAVVPAAIRAALVVRDRRCRFPGCDRPQAWCDAHHVRHWADGGPTSLDNLVLLCRRHHRAVHTRFSLEVLDRRPVFRRPDGSLLDDGRAPP